MIKRDYIGTNVMGEANEVAHAMEKLLKFGPHDKHTVNDPTNLERLQDEIADLWGALIMFQQETNLPITAKITNAAVNRKIARIEQYYKYHEARMDSFEEAAVYAAGQDAGTN